MKYVDIEQYIQNLMTDIINPALEEYQTVISLIKVEQPEPIVAIAIDIDWSQDMDEETVCTMVETYLREELEIDSLVVINV